MVYLISFFLQINGTLIRDETCILVHLPRKGRTNVIETNRISSLIDCTQNPFCG